VCEVRYSRSVKGLSGARTRRRCTYVRTIVGIDAAGVVYIGIPILLLLL